MHKTWILALLVLVAACNREPAADPAPAAEPPRAESAPVARATEIIPLEEVLKSQEAVLTQKIANTEVTVTYSRPVARGRELFGKLVPYGEVWNPGADKATAVNFTRDVQINEQPLPAGKYSVWAIPRADNWTMIFNKVGDTRHQPYPGEAQDALRLDVKPEKGQHMETLAFEFPVVEGKDAVLRMHWGEVMVPLSIRVP
jgi:hypothetical protein